ncbi:Heat shock protein SSC1, mitochondrial [Candida viswanathii]|uniref:Heat shock protein SSC1, mitochondrial n=1 Tax=Candida viswanathii TaxID=5486 RepID=A0A367YID2_9ASCO|nr:Heat shock protein SSC1, mitochondrial [Candida viswanathii]
MLRSNLQRLLFRRFSHTVLGIDLGTTNSAVAVMGSDKEPQILENEEGKRTTPSVVAFDKTGETLVGLPAKRQAVVNPENTFFATKRLIGRKFEDQEVQRDLNNVPYKIIPNTHGDATLSTSSGKIITPSEIGGLILQKLQKDAETQLNEESIDKAVVTVPAYFNDSQRQATKNSGKLVGLDILRKDGIIAVFDLGGGTFDISILEIDNGVFEVRATNGNTHLGGEDFDIQIMNYILDTFKQETGIDLSTDRFAVQRIREAAEKAKIELDHADEIEINIPFIHEDKHIKQKLTAAQFDEMVVPIIEKTIDPVKRCVRDAELKFKDIDEIRKVVEELFGKKPSTAVNPDEAVALGAAIQGAVLSGQVKNVVLLDVTPLSLGIETYGGIFTPLIPRNSATGVEIGVYQGERPLVRDNKHIGQFRLANIPHGPKGTPQIAVSFEIDADGIINVNATDKTKYPEDLPHYGKPNSVSIQVTEVGLTDSEIEKMIQESSENKKADEERRKYYEHASRAEILCTDAENAIELYGSYMEEAEKETVKEFIAVVKTMIDE